MFWKTKYISNYPFKLFIFFVIHFYRKKVSYVQQYTQSTNRTGHQVQSVHVLSNPGSRYVDRTLIGLPCNPPDVARELYSSIPLDYIYIYIYI